MTSDRPYRDAFDWAKAAGEIELQAGRQFDPGVVDAFRACEPKLRAMSKELARA
jgi:HD-GYP domain-containing protein (c-di-GMP phosphodiesterase class II)